MAELSYKEFTHFCRDDVLFYEEQEIDGIFCINSGKVKLVKKGKYDQEYIVRLTKPGDLLGLTLFTGEYYSQTAVALEDVTACYIPKYNFLSYFNKNANLAIRLMKLLCCEIEEAERRISILSQKTARQRLAEILLSLKSDYGTDKYEYLNIFLPMKDLANFACTSSATLSRLLSDFKKKDLIQIKNHKIRVVHDDKLLQIARVGVI